MSAFTRRSFVKSSGLAVLALAAKDVAAASWRVGGSARDIPWKVQQVLKRLFGDRTIQEGHVQLDVPTVAADGRVVPVLIESDLSMSPAPGSYVTAGHHPL